MTFNITVEAVIQLAAILGVGWGIARRVTRIEMKTDLMWKVFEKRLGVTREELEDDNG